MPPWHNLVRVKADLLVFAAENCARLEGFSKTSRFRKDFPVQNELCVMASVIAHRVIVWAVAFILPV
jgi:hypothetical protein